MSITITYPDAATFPVPLPAGTPSGVVSYINSDIENLPTINFNVDKTTDSSFEVSATGQLAFDMIQFIEAIRDFDNTTVDPNDTVLNYITVGKGAHFEMLLTDDCCGTNSNVLFTGTTDIDTINYCSDDCTVTFTLLDATEKGKILQCLKSRTFRERLVRDELYNSASLIDETTGGCTNGGDCLDITLVKQCTNLKPNFIQYSILALFTALSPLLIIVLAIIAVVTLVLTLLNLIAALFGFGPIVADLSNNILILLTQITGFFNNCKPKNRPLGIRIRNYLETICEVCKITGGVEDLEESTIKQLFGDYKEYHLVRQAKENRNYGDVVSALGNQTIGIHSIPDNSIFMDFLEDLESAFSLQTRVIFDNAGIPLLQLAPKRGIYNWFSSSATSFIDIENSDYADTTVSNRGFIESTYCVEARDEPFPAGYFLRYIDTKDDAVAEVAEKSYYEDNLLWGSNVDPSFVPVNSGFKGIPEIIINFGAAGVKEMDSSVSIYNTTAYDILTLFLPIPSDDGALITSKSSFKDTKILITTPTSETSPNFSPNTGAFVSVIPTVNSDIFLGLKYRAYLKNSLFNSESPDPAIIDFQYYLSRINNLQAIIGVSGEITPLLYETYFSNDFLGSDVLYQLDASNNQLKDNVYCEVPLYTGTIELKQCTCDILQYFKRLTTSSTIPMIEFDGLGQFALDTVQINFDERQILLTGGIYGSRVFI